MESIFRIILGLAGIVNVLPVLIAFFPQKIPASYGLEVDGPDMELLLRHRAVLFGIVGGYMIVSAMVGDFYSSATLMGMISMLSFILLYVIIPGEINSALKKVMKIDIWAAAVLGLAYFIHLLQVSSWQMSS